MVPQTTVDLGYLKMITDDTGVIQHGVHSVPNRKLGYTTDDNARALITAAYHYNLTKSPEDLRLATIYLSFLHYAQSPTYLFRNVMSYQRVFMDEDGTEDCLGRCLWALGFTASSSLPNNIRIVAKKLFESSIAWIGDIQSPRAKAYAMMGICEFLRLNDDGNLGLASKISILADSMIRGRKTYGSDDFPWYEGYMTYGNAVLPLGMLAAAEVTGKRAYRRNAAEAIQFLTDIEIVGDRLELVGNDGWYHRGGRRAWWDQQTIDAGYTVYLYTRAGEVLGGCEFHELAHIAHEWFFGRNRSGLWLYDPNTHGCYDAINPEGLNLNQGAESTICFLLAHMSLTDCIGDRSAVSDSHLSESMLSSEQLVIPSIA